MLDWDKIVVEVDNNTVDLTAGEVALLIAADADTVSWGNIVGDYTQQADLMLAIDSKVDIDSPEFTGTPRTPTPPAGNVSTRIANTEFVDTAIDAAMDTLPEFGALATKDKVNYNTDVTNKPSLGGLASKSTVNYETEVTNKPTIPNGALANCDVADYETQVVNKPEIPDGDLASMDYIDYESNYLRNKPEIPSISVLTPKSDVAGNWTGSAFKYQLFYYNNKLYRATKNTEGATPAGASVQTTVGGETKEIREAIDDLNASKSNRIDIASNYADYTQEGKYFYYENKLRLATSSINRASDIYSNSRQVKVGEELNRLESKFAQPFDIYKNYKAGDYVYYKQNIYRFIYDHNTGDWNNDYVVTTSYFPELSTAEYKVKSVPSVGDPTFTNLDKELRSAGAHAITYIELNSSATTTHYCKSITISGHKRITVEATSGNIAYFNGEYNTYIPNRFYSIIVEDGAILELIGNITVYNQANNGILIRRGGMVIYRANNSGEKLTINIPSTNYHDAIRVESGGKFICEGELYATRGAMVYSSYPCYPVNVQYGAEAHVNKITSSSSQFNAAIGCTGGIASYRTLSGLTTVSTSAGGRIFTGSQN